MWSDNSQQPSISTMESAMAAPTIEQYKTLVLQQGYDFTKPNAARRVAHFLNELITPIH